MTHVLQSNMERHIQVSPAEKGLMTSFEGIGSNNTLEISEKMRNAQDQKMSKERLIKALKLYAKNH